MVDSEMAINFSVRNNPGVFALLLGSGVSRESDVRSGWGILKDLIQKVAEIEDETIDSDPVDWYRDQYGEEPRYDDILEMLAPSKAERQALLEPYFEPNEDERERGVKTPSAAHESIAWLVDNGYINVIVTTNFDRLLEKALNERGVTPTVISTKAAAEGATPFAHEDAVILKIHGDYKETNIKNTSTELKSYDPAFRELLDCVFEDYGLIVCGWSAKWDEALRNALLASKSRRYNTFWAYHSNLGEEAEKVVAHRDGTDFQIEGASEFFTSLRDNVRALEDAEDGAPITRKVAQERVKRYIREDRRIDLEDLLRDETRRALDGLFDEERYPLDIDYNKDNIDSRLDAYESSIETLVSACSTCSYWDSGIEFPSTHPLHDAVRSIGTPPSPDKTFKKPWKRLRRYPSTYLMYSIGVPAIATENWESIQQLLVSTNIPINSRSNTSYSAILMVNPSKYGADYPTGTLASGTVEIKRRIKDSLRGSMKHFLPDEDRYEAAFYRFDFLTDLVLFDRGRQESSYSPFRPDSIADPDVKEDLVSAVEEEDEDWPPLQVGLFDNSLEQLETVLDEFGY